MNDTKVQRYEIDNSAYGYFLGMRKDEYGDYVTYEDHARIVAAKDAELDEARLQWTIFADGQAAQIAELDEKCAEYSYDVTMLRIKLDEQATLLAKYQRLHAADVEYDGVSKYSQRFTDVKLERLAAMEALK